MEISVNLFWIVLFIIIIHTALTHLINWMWRGIVKFDAPEDAAATVVGVIASILEALLILRLLASVIPNV